MGGTTVSRLPHLRRRTDNGLDRKARCRIGRAVMQQFEANDTTVRVLHQDDLVGGLLADRLLGGIVEPDRERMPFGVMDYFDLVILSPPPSRHPLDRP